MAIYRLIREASFDQTAITALTAAYERALVKMRLADRTDPLTELIAAKIIQVYRLGNTDDPHRLCNQALSELGVRAPE